MNINVMAPPKPVQPCISVHDLLAIPAVARAITLTKWSRAVKNGVASAFKNRRAIDRNGATPAESTSFEVFYEKVLGLIETDREFREALDPSYLFVQFPPSGVPTGYREWLDIANNHIGGSPPGTAANFVVNGADGNLEPLSLLDPTLANLNLLMVNTRANADCVAGELSERGLHTWTVDSQTPADYR